MSEDFHANQGQTGNEGKYVEHDGLYDDGPLEEEDLKSQSSGHKMDDNNKSTHSAASFSFELALPTPANVSPLNMHESVSGFDHSDLPKLPGLTDEDEEIEQSNHIAVGSEGEEAVKSDDKSDRPRRRGSTSGGPGGGEASMPPSSPRKSRNRDVLKRRHSSGAPADRRAGKKSDYALTRSHSSSRHRTSAEHKYKGSSMGVPLAHVVEEDSSEASGSKRLSPTPSSPAVRAKKALNAESESSNILKSPSGRRNRSRSSGSGRRRSKSRHRTSSKERPLRRSEKSTSSTSSRHQRSIDGEDFDRPPVQNVTSEIIKGSFLSSENGSHASARDSASDNEAIELFKGLGRKVISRSKSFSASGSGRLDVECTSCRAMIPPSNNFCGACGTKAPTVPLEVDCVSCGATIPSMDNFCGSCGARKPGSSSGIPMSPSSRQSSNRDRLARAKSFGSPRNADSPLKDPRKVAKTKWGGLRTGMEFINETKTRVERDKRSSDKKSPEDVTADFFRRSKIASEKKKKRQEEAKNGNGPSGVLVQPKLSHDKLDIVRQKLLDKVKESPQDPSGAVASPVLQTSSTSLKSKDTSSSKGRSKSKEPSRSGRSRSKSRERRRNRSKSREKAHHTGGDGRSSAHRSRSKSRERPRDGDDDGKRRRRKKKGSKWNSVKNGMDFINEAKSRAEKMKQSNAQGANVLESTEDVTADFFRRAKLASEKKQKKKEASLGSHMNMASLPDERVDTNVENGEVPKPAISLVQPKISHAKLDGIRKKLMDKVQSGNLNEEQSTSSSSQHEEAMGERVSKETPKNEKDADPNKVESGFTENKPQLKLGALKVSNLIAASKEMTGETSAPNNEIVFEADFSKMKVDPNSEELKDPQQTSKWKNLSPSLQQADQAEREDSEEEIKQNLETVPPSPRAGKSKWGALKGKGLQDLVKETRSPDIQLKGTSSSKTSSRDKASSAVSKWDTLKGANAFISATKTRSASRRRARREAKTESAEGEKFPIESDTSRAGNDASSRTSGEAAALKLLAKAKGNKSSSDDGQKVQSRVSNWDEVRSAISPQPAQMSEAVKEKKSKSSRKSSKWGALKGGIDFIHKTKTKAEKSRSSKKKTEAEITEDFLKRQKIAKEKKRKKEKTPDADEEVGANLNSSSGETTALKFLAKATKKQHTPEGAATTTTSTSGTSSTTTGSATKSSNWDLIKTMTN